jgi:hypothetical protein
MPILDITGREQDVEQILDKHCPRQKRSKMLIASDMDNSMFDNDLGILVFMEKLSYLNFWKFETHEFSSLLLPKQYRKILEEGDQGVHPELAPGLCRLALDLHTDIVFLYGLFKKLEKAHDKDKEAISTVGRIERVFARKMLEYDRIFMRIDGFLTKRKNFKGQLLMRTRFFAGQDPEVVSRLTNRVMGRRRYDLDRFVKLDIDQMGQSDGRQIVTEEQIQDVYGVESPYKEVDRLVVPVAKVSALVSSAVEKACIPTVVVTANLRDIARVAVNRSPYRRIMNQSIISPRDAIIGSELTKANGRLSCRPKGKPVFGMRKTYETLKYANEKGLKLGMVIGDSPVTDGPLMKASLVEGGIAVIVNCDLDAALVRFNEVLGLQENFRERIYVIVRSVKK